MYLSHSSRSKSVASLSRANSRTAEQPNSPNSPNSSNSRKAEQLNHRAAEQPSSRTAEQPNSCSAHTGGSACNLSQGFCENRWADAPQGAVGGGPDGRTSGTNPNRYKYEFAPVLGGSENCCSVKGSGISPNPDDSTLQTGIARWRGRPSFS